MIEPIDDVLHHFAQILEIEQQPGLVQVLAGQCDSYFVVVPVRVLALSLVVAQVVTRGKCVVDRYLVHAAPSVKRVIEPNWMRDGAVEEQVGMSPGAIALYADDSTAQLPDHPILLKLA